MRPALSRLAAFLWLIGLLQQSSAAQAQGAAAEFYRNKDISFIVTTLPGTGFDTSARVIARHLSKHIPGSPSIIVRNMPGAGGIAGTNWLYNVAPKDGLTVGMINTNIAYNPLYGDKNANFVADKFNWLGSPSKETALFVVWHTSPINTIADARKRMMALGATGAASTPAIYSRVLAHVLGLNVKIINGYTSLNYALLAMERGENDGVASPYWSSLKSEKPTWLRDKQIKVLTYWGVDRIDEIPGPYVFDLIDDERKKKVMEVSQAGLAMGRPIVAPPGVDPEKVAILRTAYDKVFKDPAYLADCEKVRLDCAYSSGGDQLLAFVRSIYAQPKHIVDEVAAIYREGQN